MWRKYMGTCYIVGAMEDGYEIKKEAGDLVIAADGGYKRLSDCQFDYVVGDFDSLGYVPQGENVIKHPKQKDDTDMLLAVKIGLAKGYKKFVLAGGLGGRLDHTLANIQVLAYLKSRGAEGILKSETTDVYFIQNESIVFPKETQGILSVFSYDKEARGVTIKGAEYKLADACLEDAFPLGVSNSFVGDETVVKVENGRLVIVHEK